MTAMMEPRTSKRRHVVMAELTDGELEALLSAVKRQRRTSGFLAGLALREWLAAHGYLQRGEYPKPKGEEDEWIRPS